MCASLIVWGKATAGWRRRSPACTPSRSRGRPAHYRTDYLDVVDSTLVVQSSSRLTFVQSCPSPPGVLTGNRKKSCPPRPPDRRRAWFAECNLHRVMRWQELVNKATNQQWAQSSEPQPLRAINDRRHHTTNPIATTRFITTSLWWAPKRKPPSVVTPAKGADRAAMLWNGFRLLRSAIGEESQIIFN